MTAKLRTKGSDYSVILIVASEAQKRNLELGSHCEAYQSSCHLLCYYESESFG